MPVYLAIRGKVFDVSAGRNFYGPGGPYENFAGRDATRGLACGSFDEEMLTKDLEGPLDDLNGLGKDEMEALSNWEDTFNAVSLALAWEGLNRKRSVRDLQTVHICNSFLRFWTRSIQHEVGAVLTSSLEISYCWRARTSR